MGETKTGKVVAVYGPVVDVQFAAEAALPAVYETLTLATIDGAPLVLEVMEHRDQHVCRCIALGPTFGLQRNAAVAAQGKALHIPHAEQLYGRVVNVLGEPIDGKGPVPPGIRVPIRTAVSSEAHVEAGSRAGAKFEIMETGIKMLDLLFPLLKGS